MSDRPKLPILPGGGGKPPEPPRPLDRELYSFRAHARLRYANPVAPAAFEVLFDGLALPTGARVVDVGCGKGELLVRLAERHAILGTGLEVSRLFLQAARDAAAARVPDAALEFLLTTPSRWPAEPGTFDAAFCVGAVHAWGRLEDALPELKNLVKSGGWVVAGDAYRRREPDPDYLAALGLPAAALATFEMQQDAVTRAGLELVDSRACPVEELDTYETLYRDAILAWCDARPDDPDAPALRERATKWWSLYDRWGRDTVGFALHVGQRP